MKRAPAAATVIALLLWGCAGGTGPTPSTRSPAPTAAPTSPAASETPAASPSAPGTATPGAAGTGPRLAGTRVELVEFAAGFDSPLYLTHAADGSGRVYVVEQAGRIRVVQPNGNVAGDAFLDIAERISSGGERGLLGLAFHPQFRSNGRLFVNYTDANGDTVISEFRANAQRADAGSERVLLRIDQPYANHNGGWIGFGRDGYLYIATGDGGSGGDPHGNGQRKDTLLAKMLRIDVNRGNPYSVPQDNPFVREPGARREIWAYGLRNPWRASFDRATGDMFIGDVGQGAFEEIDFEPAATGGRNYGWNVMEGPECFREDPCDANGLVTPVAAYRRDVGSVVTGGYVYRGRQFPELQGAYLFADFTNGKLWYLSAPAARQGPVRYAELLDSELLISSFGEDEAGELYVTDLGGGGVYRLALRRG